ncbi:MAG: hypothetical protein IAI50_16175 [Candidatus Eremiobacteraeota bacterium]|nr:hypothetical protein [Candidatus Eremiobacteraeota bacterium]
MQEPTLLYVSDDPETFRSHGRLFSGPIADKAVVRVLFDHVNGADVPIRLVAAIVGTANVGAIALLGGLAGPDTNFMGVGHLATYRFLVAHETVPGGAVSIHSVDVNGYALVDVVLKPGECIAGIFDIAASGGPFDLRIFACDPGHDTLSVYDILPDLPPSELQRRGIYMLPGSTMAAPVPWDGTAVSFEIGSDGGSLPRATIDANPNAEAHKGEYGVLKRFTSAIGANGGSLYMCPRGAAATGTFIVNGRVLQCHAVDADQTIEIATTTGGSFTLVTMPDINSTYPVRFTLGPSDETIAAAGSEGSPVYVA